MPNDFIDNDDIEKVELTIYGIKPGGGRWFSAQTLCGASGKSMKECDKIVAALQANEVQMLNFPSADIELVKEDLRMFGFLLEKQEIVEVVQENITNK